MAPSSTSPPNGASADGPTPGKSLWTIESIPGKGKGVIAAIDIKPGKLLISEAPLLTTECITSMESTERDLAQALRALPKDSQRAFLSLHNNYPGKNPLSNIIRSNGYPLGPGSEVGGIFANISRVNHSCRPNAVHAWNPLLNVETVYAVRPIKQGEEITLSYHAGGPSTTRKEILKEGFGFDCTCEICSLPAAELKASDSRLIRAQTLDSTIGDPESVRYSPGKVLKNCKTLMGIYEEEGIKDDRLTRLYFDAFQVVNMHGDQARASVWARRYCEEKKRSAGRDSIDLLEMMPFVKNPSKHDSFGSTNNWKTGVKDVPKDLDKEAFEEWLWRDKKDKASNP
ncbi:SET domain-containing protein 5 [Lachnellula arida]|uniref:SET domain-containing protein 5 n=1 Tax=Lachnellula arida TaxID=1316785 RepID=A0A8T9BH66_9HELO|nr:SET domain-containing protein 5 [Lachnellula arida]